MLKFKALVPTVLLLLAGSVSSAYAYSANPADYSPPKEMVAIHPAPPAVPAYLKLWNDTILWNNTVLWNNTMLWNNTVKWNSAFAASSNTSNIQGTGQVNGHPCGGPLPSCCTLKAESGGTNVANRGGAPYYGYWQFGIGTWGGYAGIRNPLDASAQQQDERAVQVFAGGAGASNWFGDGCYNGR